MHHCCYWCIQLFDVRFSDVTGTIAGSVKAKGWLGKNQVGPCFEKTPLFNPLNGKLLAAIFSRTNSHLNFIFSTECIVDHHKFQWYCRHYVLLVIFQNENSRQIFRHESSIDHMNAIWQIKSSWENSNFPVIP